MQKKVCSICLFNNTTYSMGLPPNPRTRMSLIICLFLCEYPHPKPLPPPEEIIILCLSFPCIFSIDCIF